MSAKDRLKATVVSDVLGGLPPELVDNADVAAAIEQPLDRIMAVVSKRVDRAEKSARANLAEVGIQQQQVRRLEQLVLVKDKQLNRAYRQFEAIAADLDDLVAQLEGASLTDLAQEVRDILTRSAMQDEDEPPTEVRP